MKYPALDVSGVDAELLEALLLDFSPTAAEQHDDTITYFFIGTDSRDEAARAIAVSWPAAVLSSRDVDDEDWARRSQANLEPITVGRITVTPPWGRTGVGPGSDPGLTPSPISLVINPSMGFGTGHHATTRLCLAALQDCPMDGRLLVDVGTGSGVLALAGRALGAREAVGLDNDADAIFSAEENLAANPALDHVRFTVGDLRDTHLPLADVVTANLTGALLTASASRLLALVAPGGTLIVSGLLAPERETVAGALLTGAELTAEAREGDWLCLVFNRQEGSAV